MEIHRTEQNLDHWPHRKAYKEINSLSCTDVWPATLLPIIMQHVAPGSTIFTDGWASYLSLNEEFQHFVVNHETSLKQEYKNAQTGEVVVCCTNMIEAS